MKAKSLIILVGAAFFFCCCSSNPSLNKRSEPVLKVTLSEDDAGKKVDVTIDGKLFTSYCWFDNVYKPVLYPVHTSAGTVITRGFPLNPREGERDDHRHQVGMWLNYGNVNGLDFWGNGHTGSINPEGGVIEHQAIESMSGGDGDGTLVTRASWKGPSGNELLAEKTEFHFNAKGSTRLIDRITTLTATNEPVVFKDTKEGMFAIRVARQLELPSNEAVTLIDAKGNPVTVKAISNNEVTGNYRSSEGISGEAVWGTRARWMNLSGNIGGENISLVICDHPRNINYPTFWHARGYGLFSANPLGASDFTKGAEVLNFSIAAGESATFRYRVIIHSGEFLTDSLINTYADDFAVKY